MIAEDRPSVRTPSFTFPGGCLRGEGNALVLDGRTLRLEPKHVDTLAHLLDHAGAVVSKEELLGTVWHGRHVTDDVLTVVIYQLRRALADQARSPRYIETIAKRGYRWIALPVRREQDAHPHAVVAGRPQHHLLPFQGLERARTAAPAAPAAPRGGTRGGRPVRRWALALGLWAMVGVALFWLGAQSPEPASPVGPTIALAATQALIVERTPASLDRALEILAWKLAADPGDITALSLKARALTFAAELESQHRQEMISEARQATAQALAAAPASSQALLSHGLLSLLHERDLPTAGASLLAAGRSAPEDSEILQATSWWLSIVGRHREALATARAAIALDPKVATRWSDLAFLAQVAGDESQAVRVADIVVEMEPASTFAPMIRLWSKQALGRAEEAVREHLTYLADRGAAAAVLHGLQEAFDAGGWAAYHRHFVSLLPAGTSPLNEAIAALYEDDLERALTHLESGAQRGDTELLWLDSYTELERLKTHPRFAALRAELGLASATMHRAGDELSRFGWAFNFGAATLGRPGAWWHRLLR